MLIIGKDERSPEYHGATARASGLLENANPYVKDDPRARKWIEGFRIGRIENANHKPKSKTVS